MGFSWFLWIFWHKEREIGQTRGGKIVKVALEVALWMWYQVVCVVFRFLKYHIYEPALADFLKRKFNSACAWLEDVVAYMAGKCTHVFYSVFYSVCFQYFRHSATGKPRSCSQAQGLHPRRHSNLSWHLRGLIKLHIAK
jgi:hypothetical protein